MKTQAAGTGRGRKGMTLKQLDADRQAKAGDNTQQQADAPAAPKAPRAKRMARPPREDVQQQAAAPAPVEAPKKAPKKADAPAAAKRSAGTGKGKANQPQQAGDASMGKQGADTSGKVPEMTEPETMRGGTKNVLIQTMALSGRGGRPAKEEDYPFSKLTPSVMVGSTIQGPSFFIPDSDSAGGKLANARKRHGVLFWSRKTVEQIDGKGPAVPGLRIWRGTPELETQARR